jgi:hypothetical protein
MTPRPATTDSAPAVPLTIPLTRQKAPVRTGTARAGPQATGLVSSADYFDVVFDPPQPIAQTTAGSTSFQYRVLQGYEFIVTSLARAAVPEPATVSMLAMGLLLGIVFARTRKRAGRTARLIGHVPRDRRLSAAWRGLTGHLMRTRIGRAGTCEIPSPNRPALSRRDTAWDFSGAIQSSLHAEGLSAASV